MRSSRAPWSWLMLMPLFASGVGFANPPHADHWFTIRPPFTEQRIKVTEATFDDELCFHVKGFASDGEHISEIAVYDASGREIARLLAPALARGAVWTRSLCPAMKKDVDMPGEWWFVATIDDIPVISASIKLAYGKRRSLEDPRTPTKPATGPRPAAPKR